MAPVWPRCVPGSSSSALGRAPGQAGTGQREGGVPFRPAGGRDLLLHLDARGGGNVRETRPDSGTRTNKKASCSVFCFVIQQVERVMSGGRGENVNCFHIGTVKVLPKVWSYAAF